MPLRPLRFPLACLLAWSLAALLGSSQALADRIALPVTLDYAIVNEALTSQLFSATDGSAEIFTDAIGCNQLTLSDPQLAGSEEGELRLTTRVRARVGTPVGARCVLPFTWVGVIETLEQAYVEPGTARIAFRITDSRILSGEKEQRRMTGMVWDWIKGHVHPRLGAVTVDLGPAIDELRVLLRDALVVADMDPQVLADSLALQSADARPEGLEIVVSLATPPQTPPGWAPGEPEAVLSDEELAQWDAAWQAWDAFATWLIKDLAGPAEPELRATLMEVLLDTRYELRDALALEHYGEDPVRGLFLSTWARLAPLLRSRELNLPGARTLELAMFISAANALQAIDQAAPHIGLKLDSQTLRRLARMLVPTVTEQELAWNTTVDPALRQLLGLEPELALEPLEDTPAAGPFAWLIPRAMAASVNPSLIQMLTGWIPGASDLERYLRTMDQLLEESIAAERKRGKVPEAFFPLYEDLVRATAWQESCWRQFVQRGGQILPIKSSAGAVGLMQVNQNVWRNIYDLDSLQHNVGYNARAGNEILAHYLVDYAIRRGEHEVRGDIHDLARATYGAYNGGPRHLTRYRRDDVSAYLRGIDAAFWEKYEAIRAKGAVAVKQCYVG